MVTVSWSCSNVQFPHYYSIDLKIVSNIIKMENIPRSAVKICVQTGNILSINEIMKKVGQTPTEELVESLKVVLKDWVPPSEVPGDTIQVTPAKVAQETSSELDDKQALKVTVKVFLTQADKDALMEAVLNIFRTLDTSFIDSLVLACAQPNSDSQSILPCLKEAWQVLEGFVEKGTLQSIGVSDLDTDLFIELHKWAKIKPSIVQINLSTCCVVPAALQDFTKQNDVQLLTHSDPAEILPESALSQVFGQDSQLRLRWLFRYQIHVKCRGVLASKGYVVCCQRRV